MRQKKTNKKSELASDDRKQEVGFYVNKHAILAARICPSDSYKGYEFKRETVGDWRNLYHTKYVKEEKHVMWKSLLKVLEVLVWSPWTDNRNQNDSA